MPLRVWCRSALILLTSLSFAGTGKITGKLVDDYGVPVPHMTVEAYPADTGFDLVLPRTTTDANGRFVLQLLTRRKLSRQRWAVYPRDEDRYYPKLLGDFYLAGNSGAAIVEITAESPTATVDLKLGRKAGALKGTVTDLATGHRVRARLDLAWVSEPQNTLGTEIGNGQFRLFIPSNTDITLQVTSSGYKPWSYPGVINVRPGEDLKIDITLEPDETTRSSGDKR